MAAETTDAFAARLSLAASNMTMMQMLYIAHRLDLFEAMHKLGPATISVIASEMNLHARYLRELLSSLVCHNVLVRHRPSSGLHDGHDGIDEDEDTYLHDRGLYSVPQKTLDTLMTRTAEAEVQPNTRGFMAWPIFLNVAQHTMDNVIASFRRPDVDSGVPFHEFRPEIVQALDLMSRGDMQASLLQHVEQSPLLVTALQRARRCLDIGCGSGTAMTILAKVFPDCQFHGIDLSPTSIDRAKSRASVLGLPNVHFHLQDVTGLTGEWDLITAFDVVHDVPQSSRVVKQIHKSLAPGGTFLMVEPGVDSRVEANLNARGGFLYGVSLLHCLTQNLAHGGDGFGAAWGTQRQRALLEQAGFQANEIERVDFTLLNEPNSPNWWVCSK